MKLNIEIKTIEQAQKLVNYLGKFDCDWDLDSGRYVVDGKSLLGVLAMGIDRPSTLTLIGSYNGIDADKVTKEIQEILK